MWWIVVSDSSKVGAVLNVYYDGDKHGIDQTSSKTNNSKKAVVYNLLFAQYKYKRCIAVNENFIRNKNINA